jgi:hypothetical protein
LFLIEFLDTAAHRGLLRPANGWNTCWTWEVRTEYPIGDQGRLDILLQSPTDSFIAAIENKVDGREQDDQMKRYAKWLHSERTETFRQLIFLTPDGHEPNAAERCVRLSYHRDIAEWLERVKARITANRLLSSIEQYLAIIRNL